MYSKFLIKGDIYKTMNNKNSLKSEPQPVGDCASIQLVAEYLMRHPADWRGRYDVEADVKDLRCYTKHIRESIDQGVDGWTDSLPLCVMVENTGNNDEALVAIVHTARQAALDQAKQKVSDNCKRIQKLLEGYILSLDPPTENSQAAEWPAVAIAEFLTYDSEHIMNGSMSIPEEAVEENEVKITGSCMHIQPGVAKDEFFLSVSCAKWWMMKNWNDS